MANFVFNIAKGAIAEKVRDGAALIVLLLKVAEADATMKDYDTVTALLAGTPDEADFTDYARKTIANGSITLTVDDTNDRVDIDVPDQTWTGAGGATNNTTTDFIVCEDGANDGVRIPLTCHDFVVTTDDNDIVAQIDSAGFFRAS